MKITIYELLGMVKEGKAPKKIRFDNIYCYYREYKNEYVDYTNKPIIQCDYVVMNSLNKEVEILEEEKKIPEKLGLTAYVKGELSYPWSKGEATLKDKINEIIDYLKSKGE